MKDTKTYCFGRFLIDLPKTAEVNGQAYEFLFGKIETERFPKGEVAFVQKMKEREADLRAGKHEDKFKLVDVRNARLPNAKIFKITKKLIGAGGDSFGFEAYFFNGRELFSMKETAYDEDKIDSVLQRLETRLLPNLRHRRAAGGGHAEETPTEPGFCIENGFIADDGKTAQYEKAGISFKFKQWPDVNVSVYARTNGDKLEESLLSRIKKPFPAEFAEVAKELKTLRKGKHVVGQHQGEEVLQAYPTDHGYHVHHFVWDVSGEPRSIFVPHIHLELGTGSGRSVGQTNMRPSITDKQAIELFDAIVNSIRLRPTGPAKTSAAEPDPNDPSGAIKRLPLGSKVSSAHNCPETGIWECAADAPVAQHRTALEQGRPMPYGLARIPAKGFSGLLGRKEDDAVEVMWTLVAYTKEQA